MYLKYRNVSVAAEAGAAARDGKRGLRLLYWSELYTKAPPFLTFSSISLCPNWHKIGPEK